MKCYETRISLIQKFIISLSVLQMSLKSAWNIRPRFMIGSQSRRAYLEREVHDAKNVQKSMMIIITN